MDQTKVSYWTKRRRICNAVSQHLELIEKSSVAVLPNVITENHDTDSVQIISHYEQEQPTFLTSSDDLCLEDNYCESAGYISSECDSDDDMNDDNLSTEACDSDSALGEQLANWAVTNLSLIHI